MVAVSAHKADQNVFVAVIPLEEVDVAPPHCVYDELALNHFMHGRCCCTQL